MTIWCPTLADRSGPLFLRIVEALADDVTHGRLPPGTRLPPQRDLAYALGVSLSTISRAYAEAGARGFTMGEVGRGTYVREPGAMATPPIPERQGRSESGPIDFAQNLPAPGQAASLLANTLAALSASPPQDLTSALDPPSAAMQQRHARALTAWLNRRIGLETASPDRLVLTTGAQHGILIAMMATTRPGDLLLTDPLTYAPLIPLARHLGLKVLPVSGAEGRLTPDALDEICARTTARVLYTTPTLHTPTTATLSLEEREALVSVARRRDLTILEDDVFGALPPKRPPPLASLAPDRVLYITSLSKTLAPGLRVGLVHGPEERLSALRTALALTAWMTPPLMTEIACRWIADGTADHLTAHHRAEASARQALAHDRLPPHLLRADPHGFHAWLTIPAPWTAESFRSEARARNILVVPAQTFSADLATGSPGPPRSDLSAVRLCLSHESSRDRVCQGLDTLAALLRTPPPETSLVV